MSIGVAVSNRGGSSRCANDTVREHLAGFEERGSEIRRRRNAGNRNVWVLIQLIHGALRASAVWRQIGIRKNGRSLRIRDEKERQRVSIVEQSEAGANDGLLVR